MSEVSDMTLWCVYDHPRDFPDVWIARRYDPIRPTGDTIVGPSRKAVESQLRKRYPHLVKFTRAERDDPAIDSVWL